MKDIDFLERYVLGFRKKLWHDSELVLAKCYNFIINEASGVIVCDLRKTSKKALYEFIKISFKNFSESPLEELRRTTFYEAIDNLYTELYDQTMQAAKARLPYFDKFYQHQKDTIFEANYKTKNFLALDRRLGKTLISASLSRIHQCKRTVVICPAIAKFDVWYKDLTQTFGFNDLYFTVLDSSKSKSFKALMERFVICNYDIVGKFMQDLIDGGIDHFIFDEAHRIKNKDSQRYKNIQKLVAMFPNARITFLSGTPIRNRVNDVFTYLQLSGHELGESYKKFLDEYTVKTNGRGGMRVTGGRNLEDLYIKMSNFMIRKRRDECLDMPANTFKQYVFKLEDYKEEYNKVIAELAEQKEISQLTGNLHSLNIITSRSKIKGITELAEDIIENDGKVVIFSNYTEPLSMLENYFKDRCVKVTGSVEAFKRSSLADRFRKEEGVEVFLGNMEAAGEAINLAVASEIIIVDFPFVPGPLQQAVDRCIQMGKTKPVNVNYTFCEDSIDEHLFELIVDKEKDINVVIDRRKDIVDRSNIVEVLINKLLKKDDLHDNIPIGVTQEEPKTESLPAVPEDDKLPVRPVAEKLLSPLEESDGQLPVNPFEAPPF